MSGHSALLAQIDGLNAHYAAVIDDDELERWPDFFTEDCEYRVIPRENHDHGLPACLIFCDSHGALVDRIVALRKANIFPEHFTRHLVGRAVLDGVDGSAIRTRTAFTVYQTRPDGRSRIFAVGKYLDQWRWTDTELRLRRRDCVIDSSLIETSLVTPI